MFAFMTWAAQGRAPCLFFFSVSCLFCFSVFGLLSAFVCACVGRELCAPLQHRDCVYSQDAVVRGDPYRGCDWRRARQERHYLRRHDAVGRHADPGRQEVSGVRRCECVRVAVASGAEQRHDRGQAGGIAHCQDSATNSHPMSMCEKVQRSSKFVILDVSPVFVRTIQDHLLAE